MRLPKLEEIKLSTIENSELRTLLIKNKVGSTPVYTDLSHLSKERLIDVITTLDFVMSELNIHPRFPYPYYILSEHIDIDSNFPILKDIDEISAYFKKETSRTTSKEQKIVDKIEVICSQINNENIYQRLEDYQTNILPQKMIKLLAKEALFLEKVLKNLKDRK